MKALSRWLSLALPLVSACTGVVESPHSPSAAGAAGSTPQATEDLGAAPEPYDPNKAVSCPADTITLGSAPMRRLSNVEYLRTMRDLFPSAVSPSLPALSADAEASGFENDARSLGVSDVAVDRWEEVAYLYTRDATASTGALAAFLPCAVSATSDESQRSCGASLVRDFGQRSQRRPLHTEEVDRYVSFFERQRKEIDFPAAVQLTAMAMLQSPTMLYRLELSPESGAGARVPLSSWEIASRLSYFLWETLPDEALFRAAKNGELSSPAQLEAQARRMLSLPKARDAVKNFYRQWLDFDRILDDEHQARVPELYPTWNAGLQRAIHAEQVRFVEMLFFEGDASFRSLLTSRETLVNASLAKLYGVPGPASEESWVSATLPEKERSGFLTRAGFLAAHAHSGNGSPPLRGVFVMERMLCETRPNPPPQANLTPPRNEAGAPARTNRALFEERTKPRDCIGCHVRIDGFGMGFEHYDAIGRYRDLDSQLPVDATGALIATGADTDGPYDGALELSERLADSERAQRCVTRQWLRYATGRAPESADSCMIERLQERFEKNGGDMRELLVDIVKSPEFSLRPAVTL
jgi:hypothetical protein